MTIKIGTTTPFVQPVLTSNGVMGGSSFAVAASSEYDSDYLAWKPFSKVSPGWHCAWEGLPAWLAWYNPVPIKVTEIQGKNRVTTPGYVDGVRDYAVQYSYDNSNWTSLQEGRITNASSGGSWTITLTEHSIFAKYWRLLITSSGDGRPCVCIAEITVYGVNAESVPVQAVYVGSTPVQAVYVGSTLVWPAGTTYYKWQNSYNVTAYTTSNTPTVGSRIAQFIGGNLCYTAEILSVSGSTLTAYSCDTPIYPSTPAVQWTYVGTEQLAPSQPMTVYSWIYPSSGSICVTPNRNPSVGDSYYGCGYDERWSISNTVLSVTTDSSGDVAKIIPEHAVSGVYLDYGGLFSPTAACSYSGLNATGDASSYAFPVSSGTITDGTHTATLSQNSSVTLAADTLSMVILGTDGVLRATTSLPPSNPGFVLYYVQSELETYGLSPYWSVDQDRRNSYTYVGGA